MHKVLHLHIKKCLIIFAEIYTTFFIETYERITLTFDRFFGLQLFAFLKTNQGLFSTPISLYHLSGFFNKILISSFFFFDFFNCKPPIPGANESGKLF
jgi:hypothetical protein